MKTLYNNEEDLQTAAQLIKQNQIVAFPTETIYGIGANIFNEEAVDKIFIIKNRDYSKPLAAHISNLKMIETLSDIIPDLFYELANIFLPGPLTMIIPANNSIPSIVTANTNSIAIRFPSNDTFIKFVDYVGTPIAGTSANVSGQQAATNPSEITAELKNNIAAIIDNGDAELKIESTVISLIQKPTILREGAIKKIEIEGKIGRKLF